MLDEPKKENVFKFVFNRKHMFEDDGITFRHEVEHSKKRKVWKKKKGKVYS